MPVTEASAEELDHPSFASLLEPAGHSSANRNETNDYLLTSLFGVNSLKLMELNGRDILFVKVRFKRDSSSWDPVQKRRGEKDKRKS